mgnify:CR=1 FL=1
MADKLRIGIIGCGGIANGKHMPALKATDKADMVAFCDIIVERAEKAAIKKLLSGSKFLLPVHDKPAKVEHGQIVGRLDMAVPGPISQTVHRRNWFAV